MTFMVDVSITILWCLPVFTYPPNLPLAPGNNSCFLSEDPPSGCPLRNLDTGEVWVSDPLITGVGFFPKQFTVGVLNAILCVSALAVSAFLVLSFSCLRPCLPSGLGCCVRLVWDAVSVVWACLQNFMGDLRFVPLFGVYGGVIFVGGNDGERGILVLYQFFEEHQSFLALFFDHIFAWNIFRWRKRNKKPSTPPAFQARPMLSENLTESFVARYADGDWCGNGGINWTVLRHHMKAKLSIAYIYIYIYIHIYIYEQSAKRLQSKVQRYDKELNTIRKR